MRSMPTAVDSSKMASRMSTGCPLRRPIEKQLAHAPDQCIPNTCAKAGSGRLRFNVMRHYSQIRPHAHACWDLAPSILVCPLALLVFMAGGGGAVCEQGHR